MAQKYVSTMEIVVDGRRYAAGEDCSDVPADTLASMLRMRQAKPVDDKKPAPKPQAAKKPAAKKEAATTTAK